MLLNEGEQISACWKLKLEQTNKWFKVYLGHTGLKCTNILVLQNANYPVGNFISPVTANLFERKLI